MNLYEHQKRIIREDPKKSLIAIGTGGGKTRICLELATGKILIICPKQQREDRTWQRNADKFGLQRNLTVLSKEDFKKKSHLLPRFETIIIDECHNVLGVTPEVRYKNKLPVPKTSQIFEAVYTFVKEKPPKRFYMASATPVTKPLHLWAIAKLFGHDWNYYEFRSRYYYEVRMGVRRIWMPKKDRDTKDRLAEKTKQFGYTGALQDWFDVPEQTHKEVEIELTAEQRAALRDLNEMEADPLVRRSRARTIENGVLYGKKIEDLEGVDNLVDKVTIFPSGKIDYILERAIEFPKMLIFATYTAQIEAIAKALKDEGYNVVTLTGQTKDRVNIIADADKSEACIVVAQSSISSGYELPSFPCVIFASKSWRYVDYEQALGRVLRVNALKKNLYIHLIVDGVDKDCHEAIMSGVDFQEKLMKNDIHSLTAVAVSE